MKLYFPVLDACVPFEFTLPAQWNGIYVDVNAVLPPIVHAVHVTAPKLHDPFTVKTSVGVVFIDVWAPTYNLLEMFA